MSAVETKRPGYFTREVKKHTSDKEGFASDTYPMDESELSYALGKDGTTRRKLARASGCIMEYVGQVAHPPPPAAPPRPPAARWRALP